MRNKADDFKTAEGKSNRPNVPIKRHQSPKTETANDDLTLGNKKKRNKSASSENSGIESCSLANGLKNPQGSITSPDDSSSFKETKRCIGRFFCESGLDFSAVNLPSFQSMMNSLCSEQTSGHIPTCEELKGGIFKDVMKEVREYVDEIRNSWVETGCSVLLDGWTDEKGRNLINILVDCPKGAIYLRSSDISDFIGNMDAMQSFIDRVLEEVGIENVVQIMTNSSSAFMKEVGKQVMKKHRTVFWTVSTSCCIELMLEKLESIDVIKETLNKTRIIASFIYSHPVALKFLQDQIDGRDSIKPSRIRSILPFLIIENIVTKKEVLKKMLFSSDPKSSTLYSTMEEKRVSELFSDRSFWGGSSTILKGVIPIVRVIEWMNKNKEEQMGYVYETIDQVKMTIKEGFNKTSQHKQFWKVIDEVWNEFLYSPLHSAGYYLNPNFFYSSDVHVDPEVTTGLLCCVVRASEDLHVQDQITIQLEKYRFGLGGAGDKGFDVSPVYWWSKYGSECPELQKLAVRILSQTCHGAPKFRLDRSLAETLFTKGRNRVEQKRLTDMIFLRYNMHLQNFCSGKIIDITSDDTMGDWVLDKARNDVSGNGDASDRGFNDLDGPSPFGPKVEPV